MGQVDNLVVDGQLLSLIVDNKHTNGTGTVAESLFQSGDEVALVDDLKTLLDLTSLGHGNESAVIADVNEPVLLEDRAQEGVEDDRRRGVRDNARLLMELLGEQVNTKVSVLTSLSRCGDTDNLARTVLEDDKITNADVVAGDGEGALVTGVGRRDVLGGATVGLEGDVGSGLKGTGNEVSGHCER